MHTFESLIKNARESVIISDDEEAKALLLRLGVLYKLTDAKAQYGTLTGPKTTMITYADHPTHFVLGVLSFGHPLQRDNGYYVFCWSKALNTPQQTDAHIDKIVELYGISKDVRIVKFTHDRGKN